MYSPASALQRWCARIIDAAIALILSATVAAVCGSTQAIPSDAVAVGTGFGAASLAVTSMLLGLLYGWGAGVGQLLTGCKSRRTRDGRHVGGFRGWMRYWGVVFLPALVVLLLASLFSAGGGTIDTIWGDDIRVFKRQGTRHVTQSDERFHRERFHRERFHHHGGDDDPYQYRDPRQERFAQPDHPPSQQPPGR